MVMPRPPWWPAPLASPWAHDKDYNAADPVNLVFLGVRLSDVTAHLTSKGWGPPTILWFYVADDQWLHYENQMNPQKKQLAKNYYRPPTGFRVHVRFWEFDTIVVGSAHWERLVAKHTPLSFERAEKIVAREFVVSTWKVSYDAAILPWTFLHSPSSNGYATLIQRV